MAGTLSDVSGSLKDTFPQAIVEPFVQQMRPFTDGYLNKNPSRLRITEGHKAHFAFNLNTPQNVGHMTDGDQYPSPKDRTEIQGTVQGVLFPGSFLISEGLLNVAKSNTSAFNGGELKRRVKETFADAGKYMEQMFLATYGTGSIGTVEAVIATNIFSVAKPEGSIDLFPENRLISVRTTDGGDTPRDSLDARTISSYDPDTRYLTYSDTDQTPVAGDYIHVVTKASQTDLSTISPNGMRGIIDDGTYLGSLHAQSRTTYPKLKAVVAANGGTLRDLTEAILVDAYDKVRRLTGKAPTDIWMNVGQARKFLDYVAPDRRYIQQGRNLTPLAIGYNKSTLVFQGTGGEVPINLSFDIVPREIMLVNREYLWHYQALKLSWWGEGSMLKAVPVSGGYKAAYFAGLRAIENIGTDYPRTHCMIRDLKDPLCGD